MTVAAYDTLKGTAFPFQNPQKENLSTLQHLSFDTVQACSGVRRHHGPHLCRSLAKLLPRPSPRPLVEVRRRPDHHPGMQPRDRRLGRLLAGPAGSCSHPMRPPPCRVRIQPVPVRPAATLTCDCSKILFIPSAFDQAAVIRLALQVSGSMRWVWCSTSTRSTFEGSSRFGPDGRLCSGCSRGNKAQGFSGGAWMQQAPVRWPAGPHSHPAAAALHRRQQKNHRSSHIPGALLTRLPGVATQPSVAMPIEIAHARQGIMDSTTSLMHAC